MKLGVGLLQESGPELVLGVGVSEGQLASLAGQEVIHHHLHPLPVLPEPEEEDAGVVVCEGLAGREDVLQPVPLVGQAGEGGQEPAVAELALVDVVPGGPVYVEVRLPADLPRPQPGQAPGPPAVVEGALRGGELLVSEETARPQMELLAR